MRKPVFTTHERAELERVMETTQQLLPLYEALAATPHPGDHDRQMLQRLSATLDDVLEYSSVMLARIQAARFHQSLDHRLPTPPAADPARPLAQPVPATHPQ